VQRDQVPLILKVIRVLEQRTQLLEVLLLMQKAVMVAVVQ
jgi:hypothetical protein